MHILLYERITFLIVAGTLGLFILAFLFGTAGVVLTYQPELPGRIARALARAEEWIRNVYAQAKRIYAMSAQEAGLIRAGVSARFRSLRT